jgi:hypothetical protein
MVWISLPWISGVTCDAFGKVPLFSLDHSLVQATPLARLGRLLRESSPHWSPPSPQVLHFYRVVLRVMKAVAFLFLYKFFRNQKAVCFQCRGRLPRRVSWAVLHWSCPFLNLVSRHCNNRLYLPRPSFFAL